MHRIIIAGGRHFSNYALMKHKLNNILASMHGYELISGGASGADALAEKYALEQDIPIVIMPADWKRYKTAAGPIRNDEMAKIATHLIAFWDGTSKGTKNMIDTAKAYGLQIRVIIYNQ